MLDVPGPIVHIGGGHELAALLQAGDQAGDAGCSRRVHGGGVPAGPDPRMMSGLCLWTLMYNLPLF